MLILLYFVISSAFELKMVNNIATPFSVNAKGRHLSPPQLEVPNWHLKISYTFFVTSNVPPASIVRFERHTAPRGRGRA
jgi:hypothetical protein